ncbi:MAG: HupE/UreJ family protein [Salegentibacter sp.]|uniref:HupE / UreJ protein n=1 Tax=Salegentibacter flavus TaxID=287099 RepID=A0A1I5AVD0_9FLAO|nr:MULTISPECIES: HupE/UreJ family protein [Salegentibacter]MDR9455905.1 HupE/UreJ family protein [Salegentibacter sp.]SFN66397.1 HupE / UreJ protein [Salegentibacter flavus]
MSQFWLYFRLGLEHVLDWQAYDHILFLIVLVAAYSFTSWKKIVWLVTLFTLGHTLALFLSVYEIVKVDPAWVELLIPVTIIVTAIYNIFTAGRKEHNKNANLLYFTTIFFGLIHGLGFSSYFKMVASNTDSYFLPLIEFALGIETAQIIVVLGVMILAFIAQNIFQVSKRDWVLVVSSIVIGIILPILHENFLAI